MQPMLTGTAVVGLGRWGKNIARILREQSNLRAYATTGNEENAAWAAEHLPNVEALSFEELLSNTEVSALVIATPISTHAQLARTALLAGKHVFVEKPAAETSTAADDMARIATNQGRAFMTGYIFNSHPAYTFLKQEVARADITRIECVWRKEGSFTESIEMNLLTHHLAIAIGMLGTPLQGRITHREAVRTACDRIETELAYSSAVFRSSIDRAASEKSHTIRVHCNNNRLYEWVDGAVRTNDGHIVFESNAEPLAVEMASFISYAEGGAIPESALHFGAEVLRAHELLCDGMGA